MECNANYLATAGLSSSGYASEQWVRSRTAQATTISIATLPASTVYKWIVAKTRFQQTEGGRNQFCPVFFIVYTASTNAWLPLVRFQICISSRALLRCIYSFNECLITSSKGSNLYTNPLLICSFTMHYTWSYYLRLVPIPHKLQTSCLYYKGFNCSTMHPYIPTLTS